MYMFVVPYQCIAHYSTTFTYTFIGIMHTYYLIIQLQTWIKFETVLSTELQWKRRPLSWPRRTPPYVIIYSICASCFCYYYVVLVIMNVWLLVIKLVRDSCKQHEMVQALCPYTGSTTKHL